MWATYISTINVTTNATGLRWEKSSSTFGLEQGGYVPQLVMEKFFSMSLVQGGDIPPEASGSAWDQPKLADRPPWQAGC